MVVPSSDDKTLHTVDNVCGYLSAVVYDFSQESVTSNSWCHTRGQVICRNLATDDWNHQVTATDQKFSTAAEPTDRL